jgi:hypothetical protein
MDGGQFNLSEKTKGKLFEATRRSTFNTLKLLRE